MQILNTHIDAGSGEFQSRRAHNLKLRDELESTLEMCMTGGPPEARDKHTARGKLLVRDRISLLLDPHTPFLEIAPLAALGQYDDQFPSAGLVTGIGRIHGKEAMIVGNDATVKGGTYVKESIKKHLRAQEIALQNRLPCVYLVDSGGVFLPRQSEVFPDRDDFGRIFFNQARLSAEGIPQISVVMGSCTAGGAYVPAMSDETIIVRNQGTIFLGGPPLVRAATGEVIDAETLGGGRVHTEESGVADYLADNDGEALQRCRDIFESIRTDPRGSFPSREVAPPLYPADDLYGILPESVREPVDVREIIARLVDGSEFTEFKQRYGTTLVTGFARIMGLEVGILGNNGILFSESALKGTHFIQLCDQRNIPMVFLQNIAGFMVGKEAEHGGIAKDGAKMVQAVANARVPRFTVVTGGSFGAGNYAMSGRAYEPRLLFMWPNARIGVMGGEQAAGVLSAIRTEQLEARGETPTEKELEEIRRPILEKYEREGSPYFSSSRLWDDGVIDPAKTREVLGLALAMAWKDADQPRRTGVFRM
ncbi:MAG: carboxyl transferase domain-containing protein [Bacteroidales bacterium]